MALYQNSVLKKHLKLLDQDKLNKAYNKYSKYFLNPTIQDNIRSSKEEEYQGIFLTELFVNILDYTLKPKANFNLVAEYKNQNNARKADGAILDNDIAIGVIELKGTNTKDLESIRKQAFDYKANQKGCTYVITSNFEKLRFYINDATEFEEFNLFELPQERFELLYLCLQKDNIINNIPLQIKEASIVVEEQITKQFYKDYSLFKRELYRDLVKRNAKRLKNTQNHTEISQELHEEQKTELLSLEKNVKLTLFKKSQKLIDRFLFIFFAEDRGLLPPNSTQQILDKWKADEDFGDERPLYNLFKQYFKFLDQGRQGTGNRAEIYAYNGGLFKEDTLLDNLEIDNDLLHKYTKQLAGYDFESQVDVNILGHIFENSLNEIESVNAEIEGGDFDKQKSKRKKDGVFYTPKYITKYIVENTIGKLCDDKKIELGFKEEEYFKGRKNRNKSTISKLVSILDTYRDWLLQLTICDPACGSGAFLNQALDFLIKEHTYVDELKTKVLGGGLQFPDIENTILENNIYGVDLNEESVEIAKLSLWLRTAQPRRKLNNLSSNIKCGNSLIESKTVAGDKAFNWQEQFPKIFENGGFDVIIGNPPYVATKQIRSVDRDFFWKKYEELLFSEMDLYEIFTYECLKNKIKPNGYLGFITPNSYYTSKSFIHYRDFIVNEFQIKEIIDFPYRFFPFNEVNTETSILIIKNTNPRNNLVRLSTIDRGRIKYNKSIESSTMSSNILIEQKSISTIFNNEIIIKQNSIIQKLLNSKKLFGDDLELHKGWMSVPKKCSIDNVNFDTGIFSKEEINKLKIVDNCKKYLEGRDIHRYYIDDVNKYVCVNVIDKKTENWHLQNKIILQRIVGQNKNKIFATIDYDNHIIFPNANLVNAKNNKEVSTYLPILNSTLISYFYNIYFGESNTNFTKTAFEKLPLPDLTLLQEKELSQHCFNTIERIRLFNKKRDKFQNYLQQKFQIEKFSRKLQNWHELEFGEFIKELNKAIKVNNKIRVKDGLEEVPTLTKKDEFEWLDLFEENKQKAQELQTQINQTDKEIDAMVYQLYGLTDEEIKIVEAS